MKNLKNILSVALLATTVAFTSCEKDGDDPEPKPEPKEFTVTVINADYNTDEYEKLGIAMDASSVSYIKLDTVNDFSDIDGSSMVIFMKGNDGIVPDLFDLSDTTDLGVRIDVKFTEHLQKFVNDGGILWVDGLDMMYGAYGSAPDEFPAGKFLNDVVGISKYASQSKADDGGTGVANYDKDASATFMSVETVEWEFSTLWYADGFEITADAKPLFRMGGDENYPLKGQVTGLYKNNIIWTGLRLGKIGDQDKINAIVSDVFTAASGDENPFVK